MGILGKNCQKKKEDKEDASLIHLRLPFVKADFYFARGIQPILSLRQDICQPRLLTLTSLPEKVNITLKFFGYIRSRWPR
jgi:hypothetical protein